MWDVIHHLKDAPILPFAEHSSFGCAICDPVIALWCFAGGPSVLGRLRARRPAGSVFRTGGHTRLPGSWPASSHLRRRWPHG
ncbi:DUF6010 family protein [Streptosporangium lutulentum]|uniref:DUF6010 family protein n=1 Tax=Streptosporangium lutulentum TaxID=1461250 RepID=UPI0027D81C36|nr:DUF6010 family protein [Streptosporangium lutulentum]